MNPPKVIVNAEPPNEWFEVVGHGLERHNTAVPVQNFVRVTEPAGCASETR